MTRHSLELRRKAVALALVHGAAEAARRCGVPRGTVAAWVHRDAPGVAAMQRVQTAAAVETLKLNRKERIAKMAERLLDEAEEELNRLRSGITVTKMAASGKVQTWKQAEPEPSDRRAIATTVAILLDKSQLLAGGATSRSEHATADQAIGEVEQLKKKLRLRVVNGPAE